MDKKETEELKKKLFNKKENGWNCKNQEERENFINNINKHISNIYKEY